MIIAYTGKPWFSVRRVAEFEDDFNRQGLTWSEFKSVSEALKTDRDLSSDNPIFAEVFQPGIGNYLTPSHPALFQGHAVRKANPAPELGADTEEVLGDVLALGDRTIARLFDNGIVDGPASKGRGVAA